MKLRRFVLRHKVVAIAALFVVASGAVTLISNPWWHEVWAQATTHRPEPYTSLSFLDTGHLPTYTKPEVQQHITFRVANHQTVQTTYEYRVLLNTDTASTLLKSSTVTLADGASLDQTFEFALPQPDMSGQIVVQLVHRSEFITFEVKS
jgi:hypothetical protein